MMKITIACDVNPVIIPEKTGIGWVAFELLDQLDRIDDFEMIAQAFLKNRDDNQRYQNLCRDSWIKDFKRFIPVELYKMIWPFIPFPYSLIFRKQGDVQLFFSNHVPPGTK